MAQSALAHAPEAPAHAPEASVHATAAPAQQGKPKRASRAKGSASRSSALWGDEFFGHQPTSTADLPDPRPLLENLTGCVVEVLAGARELEQIARWVSDDVYRNLVKRVVLSTRARAARGQRVVRPTITLGTVRVCHPRDGVVEASIVVRGHARARAVAIRLEGLDRRWRATALHVL